MKHAIQFEWNRCICGKGLKLSIMISLLLVILNLVHTYEQFVINPNEIISSYPTIATQAWLPLSFSFVFRALYYVMFPILAVLPMGSSFHRDMKTGYIKNICSKTARTYYYNAKYIVAFCAGFLVIILPILLDLMIQLCLYPVLPAEPFGYLGWVHDGDFMAAIYYRNPLLYALLYSLVDGLFGGLISVCALCISRYLKNVFSVIMVPFVFYMISDLVLKTMGMEKYSLSVMVDALRVSKLPGITVAGGLILGISMSYWWFCSYERRKDVL